MKINQKTLTKMVAAEAGVSTSTAGDVLRAFYDTVARAMAAGDSVAITNFGTFGLRSYAERPAVDPNTRTPITAPAVTVPAFVSSAALRRAVNLGDVKVTLRKLPSR